MILQTSANILSDLLATESGETSHLESVRDALILEKASALTPPSEDLISNDRTTLPHQKR